MTYPGFGGWQLGLDKAFSFYRWILSKLSVDWTTTRYFLKLSFLFLLNKAYSLCVWSGNLALLLAVTESWKYVTGKALTDFRRVFNGLPYSISILSCLVRSFCQSANHSLIGNDWCFFTAILPGTFLCRYFTLFWHSDFTFRVLVARRQMDAVGCFSLRAHRNRWWMVFVLLLLLADSVISLLPVSCKQ